MEVNPKMSVTNYLENEASKLSYSECDFIIDVLKKDGNCDILPEDLDSFINTIIAKLERQKCYAP